MIVALFLLLLLDYYATPAFLDFVNYFIRTYLETRIEKELEDFHSRAGVRRGAAGVLPGAGRSRRVDAGGRRRPGTLSCRHCSPGSRRFPRPGRSRSRSSRTPGTATRTRPSSSTRPTKQRRNAPRSRSPRSWSWPSRSAARSPANTASAASRRRAASHPARPPGHRAEQAGRAVPRPGQHRQPGRGHLGPAGPLELRSSVAEFVLEVDPDDLIE